VWWPPARNNKNLCRVVPRQDSDETSTRRDEASRRRRVSAGTLKVISPRMHGLHYPLVLGIAQRARRSSLNEERPRESDDEAPVISTRDHATDPQGRARKGSTMSIFGRIMEKLGFGAAPAQA